MGVIVAINDKEDRSAVSEALSNQGIDAQEAHTGDHVLDLAKESQPELLILDLVLPRLSGAEVLQTLERTHSWVKEVPVLIVITDETNEEELDAIKKICPNCAFAKSNWETTHITAKAQELMNNKKRT